MISRRSAVVGLGAGLVSGGAVVGAPGTMRVAVIGGPPPKIFNQLSIAAAGPSESKLDGVLIAGRAEGDAKRYLEAGVPVWIDGPLAASVSEASDLIAAAARAKTALMAATGQEFLPSTSFLRRRAAEVAPLSAAMLAVSATERTGVEAVNLACAIFGPTAAKVSRIVTSAKEPNYTIALEYHHDRPWQVVAQGTPSTACRAWVHFYGTDHSELMDDALHAAIAMLEMFRTRKAPQDPAHLLAKTKLYLAACRSTDWGEGRPFAVGDLDENWRLHA